MSAALMRLLQDCRERTAVALEYESPDAEPLIAGDVAEQLYRIVREAISSAIGISGCMAVHVALGLRRDELTLSVAATHASNSAQEWRKAMNLSLMEYRARIIGGALRVEASSGGVTRMSVRAPLQGVNYSTSAPFRGGGST